MELENRKCLLKLWNNRIRSVPELSRLTGIPLRTCYNFKSRVESGKCMERAPGSGAISKFSENDNRRIEQLAHCNPTLSAARIGGLAVERGGPYVHRTTISRNLNKAG